MVISQVAEHFRGISHILVYVIEVGKQQLSPPVELVESFVPTGNCREHLVQLGHELYRVAHCQFRTAAKQVAYGCISRTPQRLVGKPCKCLVEK